MVNLVCRAVLLYLLLAQAPAFCSQPAEGESLRDYVRRNQGRYAYGLYLANKKVGWGVAEARLEDENGQDVLVVDDEVVLALRMFGEEHKARMCEKDVYELTGDGLLIRVEATEEEDGQVSTQKAVRKDDQLVITTVKDGVESKRTTPLSKDTIAQMVRLDRWLGGPPKKGDTFEEYGLDLDQTDDVDTKAVYRFLERRRVRWGGAPMMVNEVEATMYGATMKALVLDDGNVLKGNMGPFEVRMEEEAIAKNLTAAKFDMLLRVPVDRGLGDPKEVDALTLKCVTDFAFPESHRQQAQKKGDSVILKLARDFSAEAAKPLSDDDRTKYTQTTPSIQSDQPKIRALAAKIVGKEKDPVKSADRLQKWIFENLDMTHNKNASTALRILKNRAGDCTECALLFVALARSLEIPARDVTGLMFADDDEPYFAWHAWAEIHDGKQWLSVDPAWNEMLVDATHIKLGEGMEGFAWIAVVGDLRFQVVDVQHRNE
ncbi:MAG: transglutaminase domain-containing protein [Planctomycetes bacterium]|nr:transglutaminase domain-containing protein [Planctomycetota bacterium]MBL7044344.1 transglutaminase domain-containing protein [Pirellulaceae bacterium]